jgi:hypothetical protein
MSGRTGILHLPLLRAGIPYRSVDVAPLHDLASGEQIAEISQANAGLIARDLSMASMASMASVASGGSAAASAAAGARVSLAALPLGERLEICRRAADLFADGELAIGWEGETQSPADYLRDLSATTGIPRVLARANLEKLRATLAQMEDVIAGLTRGLDAGAVAPEAPDAPAPAALPSPPNPLNPLNPLPRTSGGREAGVSSPAGAPKAHGQLRPRAASSNHFQRTTDVLGAVLPSNSPGVHGLWLPAPALGVGVALKPGREEPWTPLRLLAALAAAGCPPAALSCYFTGHAGAAEILLRAGRSLLFGDAATVRPWRGDPRVQVHGPGFSKVIFGADQLAEWPAHLELVASSILANGGRSCINASGVWLPRSRVGGGTGGGTAAGRELAEALARRLAAVEPRPLDDPEAQLAAWPAPAAARRVSDWIDAQLAPGEAEDLTAAVRGGGRVAELGGCTFLLPTVLWVRDPGHPLAHTELLFPFCAVVEAPPARLLAQIGPTLVATALTADEEFRRELLACRDIDHLHLGPVPTWSVSFDQPHEGNLFDLLYRRRALREASLGADLRPRPGPAAGSAAAGSLAPVAPAAASTPPAGQGVAGR